jgi:hypothetical protein
MSLQIGKLRLAEAVRQKAHSAQWGRWHIAHDPLVYERQPYNLVEIFKLFRFHLNFKCIISFLTRITSKMNGISLLSSTSLLKRKSHTLDNVYLNSYPDRKQWNLPCLIAETLLPRNTMIKCNTLNYSH